VNKAKYEKYSFNGKKRTIMPLIREQHNRIKQSLSKVDYVNISQYQM